MDSLRSSKCVCVSEDEKNKTEKPNSREEREKNHLAYH